MKRLKNKIGKEALLKIVYLVLPLVFLFLSSSVKAEEDAHTSDLAATHGESAGETEKEKEVRVAKRESQEEIRLSTLNQLHIKDSDKKKIEEVKLDTRTDNSVVQIIEPESPHEVVKGVCGTLLDFMGKVEILDSSRSHILESSINAAFPCGSWVSVRSGWAQIKFREGQKVRLGHETLVQIRSDEDQIVLYRGVVYVESGSGSREFSLATSTGRARLKRGKIIFINNTESDTTQLIALENSATFENRFEVERRVQLYAGESSELNFKQLRVIPLLPSSVASASLKVVLDQLDVPDSDKTQAIRIAIARQDRKFAILRKEDAPDKSEESNYEMNTGGRGLASVDTAKKKANERLKKINQPYLRNSYDPGYQKLESKLVSRITGGVSSGRRLVSPGAHRPQARGLASQAPEQEPVISQHLLPAEKAAKQKLIQVLSEIKID